LEHKIGIDLTVSSTLKKPTKMEQIQISFSKIVVGTRKAAKYLKNKIETKLIGYVGLKNVHALSLHTLQTKSKRSWLFTHILNFMNYKADFMKQIPIVKSFKRRLIRFGSCVSFLQWPIPMQLHINEIFTQSLTNVDSRKYLLFLLQENAALQHIS